MTLLGECTLTSSCTTTLKGQKEACLLCQIKITTHSQSVLQMGSVPYRVTTLCSTPQKTRRHLLSRLPRSTAFSENSVSNLMKISRLMIHFSMNEIFQGCNKIAMAMKYTARISMRATQWQPLHAQASLVAKPLMPTDSRRLRSLTFIPRVSLWYLKCKRAISLRRVFLLAELNVYRSS